MLGERMKQHNVNVWLVNTGWSGGGVGVGKRMKLAYTRAMITAALEGKLQQVDYIKHPVFGLAMPTTCPNVPSEVLNPRNTWASAAEYDKKAAALAQSFVENFEQFAARADEETLAAAPLVAEKA
jgi:phosphoenolpyruvate carboxykinase (ATP)